MTGRQRETLLTGRDVALWLNTAQSTLKRWRRLGLGPAYIRIGRAIRYDPATVRTWLAAQQSAGEG